MRKHLPLIIILVVSAVIHFVFFGYPSETVFDEVHFGKFISGYFTHEYFFDIHPPLGKLLISAMGYIGGFAPSFSFAQIGQQFPDDTYIWLRLLPMIAGTLVPIFVYLLAKRLGFSNLASFSAGILISLDNALLSQSRFILLDLFLLLFGFSAMWAYFKYRQDDRISFLFLAGILGTLSVSVKWTGGTFLLIILILEIIALIKVKDLGKFKKLCLPLLSLVGIPALIYFLIFAMHLGLLNKAGTGDAFMTLGFQKTLRGSIYNNDPAVKPANLFQKFFELNFQMYKSNATLTAGHPYASKWYTWPFMARPIYYWYHAPGPTENAPSRIYFIGNPLVWWGSTVAVIYALILVIGKKNKLEQGFSRNVATLNLLLGSYFINLLPFLSIKRAMFLYHYLAASIFAILILCYLTDHLPKKKLIFGIIIGASTVSFIFLSPLTYGLPLNDASYNLRVWFPSWK